MTEAESVYHPLFAPNVEDEDYDPDAAPPDIQEIYVQRKENGKYLTAPRSFRPDELVSLETLYSEFGGGEYLLVGRNSRKQIVRKVIHLLPGPSKPMFDEGPPIPAKPAPVAASNPMGALMGGSPEGGIMGIIMMMMQNMMQQANQASERQTQMMLAMMQASAQGNQAQMAAMQENMRAQAERDQRDKQSQIELITRLTEASKGGGGSNDFFKGVEFMKQFSTGQLETVLAKAKSGESDGLNLESILETLMQGFQAFNAYQELSKGGTPAIPGVTPTPEVVQ